MKKLILFITCACCIIACNKSKHSSSVTPSTGNPLISGLTSVCRFMDVSAGIHSGYRYVNWDFTGNNPIIAIPDTDSVYLHTEQVTFDGAKVSQIISPGAIRLITSITYTAANLPDTITSRFDYLMAGAKIVVFKYTGSKIDQAIVAFTSNVSDTFYWSAADLYYFTYTGENISRIVNSHYNGTSGRDNYTYNYSSGTRVNNFGGSWPTFLTLYFLDYQGLGDLVINMPYYTNPNIIDSADGIKSTTITDVAGRQHVHILGGDTTFYFY